MCVSVGVCVSVSVCELVRVVVTLQGRSPRCLGVTCSGHQAHRAPIRRRFVHCARGQKIPVAKEGAGAVVEFGVRFVGWHC